jgi:ubiquinone/menaquinone biosynthesis C-methylase UbiE
MVIQANMNLLTRKMNCDRIARWYEAAEHLSFRRALEYRRLAYVGRLGECRRALLCGGGDGRFLAGLLLANPEVEVTYVDLSMEMLRIAEQRVALLGKSYRNRVQFFCADVLTFVPPHGGYDLFATHFFLDCLTRDDIRTLILKMMKWARPQAKWVLSEFRYSRSLFGRVWTGAIIRSLYAAFRVATGLRVTHITPHTALLHSAGFQRQQREIATGGLLISELWEYRREIPCDWIDH